MTYPFQLTWHASSGTESDRHVLSVRIPFGQAPSLHLLRHRTSGFVRRLRRYYEPVRLPLPVHHRRTSEDFPTRPARLLEGRQGISRFSRKVFPCMRGVFDRAGFCDSLRWRCRGCGLPHSFTASAPRSELSRLDTQPVRAPVNASTLRSCATPHDSGSVWVAKPSPYDSFIHNTLPV
jgi:hypothetical protein